MPAEDQSRALESSTRLHVDVISIKRLLKSTLPILTKDVKSLSVQAYFQITDLIAEIEREEDEMHKPLCDAPRSEALSHYRRQLRESGHISSAEVIQAENGLLPLIPIKVPITPPFFYFPLASYLPLLLRRYPGDVIPLSRASFSSKISQLLSTLGEKHPQLSPLPPFLTSAENGLLPLIPIKVPITPPFFYFPLASYLPLLLRRYPGDVIPLSRASFSSKISQLLSTLGEKHPQLSPLPPFLTSTVRPVLLALYPPQQERVVFECLTKDLARVQGDKRCPRGEYRSHSSHGHHLSIYHHPYNVKGKPFLSLDHIQISSWINQKMCSIQPTSVPIKDLSLQMDKLARNEHCHHVALSLDAHNLPEAAREIGSGCISLSFLRNGSYIPGDVFDGLHVPSLREFLVELFGSVNDVTSTLSDDVVPLSAEFVMLCDEAQSDIERSEEFESSDGEGITRRDFNICRKMWGGLWDKRYASDVDGDGRVVGMLTPIQLRSFLMSANLTVELLTRVIKDINAIISAGDGV
ncbi:hypothetical protein ADUPG1_011404 [Aduncisulcus paluster]|uniref:Uncharacterized protein n=1 Tax=Aduncisulcus paluster TaxID=2918883 RepID=A0ABQ5JVU6_9EUKA|nr:hypothetical protein ADUPG1_011404 [Aduncisulcus paluster]